MIAGSTRSRPTSAATSPRASDRARTSPAREVPASFSAPPGGVRRRRRRRRGQGPLQPGRRDPRDREPAAPSGAPADYRRAIFAYNHASWYVDDVLARAAATAAPPSPRREGDPSTCRLAVRRASPVRARGPGGPRRRGAADRPRPPTALSLRGRWPPAGPAARRRSHLRDVLWLLRRYDVRVSAAREAGHDTHSDGTALDLVPAVGVSQRDWDDSAGRLAQTSAGPMAAVTPAPAPPAPLNRRSSGSATRATRTTGPRAPARAAAPRTSTSPGFRAATARARSSRPAGGSWPSRCPAR